MTVFPLGTPIWQRFKNSSQLPYHTTAEGPGVVVCQSSLKKFPICCVEKNSSKLTFSRSTKVLTVTLELSELKACAGGILLRGIILHWHRCSLFGSCLILFTNVLSHSGFILINLSPSRSLLSALLCIREGSSFLQKKGGFS